MAPHTTKSGYFITVEGIEGVGKSSSVPALCAYLSAAGVPLLATREPGGTPVAEAIRQILLTHYAETITAETELLLMFAGRAQHFTHVIQPALTAGQWVVCDRFTDATYAYQGGGRGMDTEQIALLEQRIQGKVRPDLTLLLDAPVSIALARAKNRTAADRFEIEEATFFERVRACYLARAQQYPHQYAIIDATQPQAEVIATLIATVRQRLPLP